jgi:hypothetical protein
MHFAKLQAFLLGRSTRVLRNTNYYYVSTSYVSHLYVPVTSIYPGALNFKLQPLRIPYWYGVLRVYGIIGQAN